MTKMHQQEALNDKIDGIFMKKYVFITKII